MEKEKKYEFTGVKITWDGGIVLKLIRAVKDFGFVKKGEMGGWIESEDNLSQ